MIFDSEEFKELKKKYSDSSIYAAPPAIQRFDLHQFSGEKDFLEQTVQMVPECKRKYMISCLLSENWGVHLGIWFELHLYRWLLDNCSLKAVFTDDKGKPDFRLSNSPDIFIEAKAILQDLSDRERKQLELEFITQLRRLKFSAEIYVNDIKLNSFDSIPLLVENIEKLLGKKKIGKETIQIDDGSVVVLDILEFDGYQRKLGVSGFPHGFAVNAEKLRKPLKKKFEKYSTYRKSENTYLIGVFLEDHIYGPEDVVSAIFGDVEYLFDSDKNKIVGSRIDRKGIHYVGKEYKYRSVSGILVFKESYLTEEKRRSLDGFFIENPYAYDYGIFSPDIFNVTSSFHVIIKSTSNAEMKWISKHE